MTDARLPQYLVAIVYPESFDMENFKEICRQEDFYYCYILHNKDRDEFGNFKKPHYHVFLDLMSKQVRKSMLEKLGLDNSLYQRCRDPYAYLKYMIHEE